MRKPRMLGLVGMLLSFVLMLAATGFAQEWQLTVQSTGSSYPYPLPGVTITGTAPGTTNYNAWLDDEEEVTLTAPSLFESANKTYSFVNWTVGTQNYSSNPVEFEITANITAIARYHQLDCHVYVESSPVEGVTIVGTIPGTTNYDFIEDEFYWLELYAEDDIVVNNQPYHFQHWTYNGNVDDEWDNTMMCWVRDNLHLAAVYQPVWTLYVRSQPITGISITGDPAGTTNYEDELIDGTEVTLTAPEEVSGDYFFAHWVLDSSNQTTNPITFNIDEDTMAGAVYYHAENYNLACGETYHVKTGIPCQEMHVYWRHSDGAQWTELTPGSDVVFPPYDHYIVWYDYATFYDFALPPVGSDEVELVHVADPVLTVKSWPVQNISITGDYPGTTNYLAYPEYNSEVTLTAPIEVETAKGKWIMESWYDSGYGAPIFDDTLEFTMTADRTVEACYEWYGNVSVTSTPPGVIISGNPAGTTNYEHQTYFEVDVTAPAMYYTEGPSYRFLHWIKDGVTQTEGEQDLWFILDNGEDADICAEYALQLRLDVLSTPITEVTITGTPAGTTNYYAYVDENSQVTLTAPIVIETSEGQWVLESWYDSQAGSPIFDDTIEFTMTADRTVEACYEWEGNVSVTSTPPGVVISGYPAGTTNYEHLVYFYAHVTAPAMYYTEGPSYRFLHWVKDGTPQTEGERNLYFSLDNGEGADIHAEYALQLGLNVQSTPVTGITITGTPAGTTNYYTDVDEDSQVTLTAPCQISGYVFSKWVLDGVDQSTNPLTFYIDDDSTAVAIYEEE